MDDKQSSQTGHIGAPLEPDRVFRPGGKGAWHLVAHREYGVVWSSCGIRALEKDCRRPTEPVQVHDLCGTCARAAKERLGKVPPQDQGGADPRGA
jgi:hypothetical protein